MSPGDIVFLYSDGVYDGSDEEGRHRLEEVVRINKHRAAKEICAAILDHALKEDERLRHTGEEDVIDDKTALIIKHS